MHRLGRNLRRRCALALGLAVLVPGLAAGLTGCGQAGAEPHPADVPVAQVSVSACGDGWAPTRAGRQHFVVANTDSRPGEVQLISAHTGEMYADVEPFGPATRRPIDVVLAAGAYRLRCVMEDEAAVEGPVVHLLGTAGSPTPGLRPVTSADLYPIAKAYQAYVAGRLPLLLEQVLRLRADVARRDVATARADWLTAHLTYERLGAAYDAFGSLNDDINGLPWGLPGGVHDPHWLGFHRIEYALWGRHPLSGTAPVATRLVHDVRRLRTEFAAVQIDPITIAIRAHEISENALQLSLGARDDLGSHTDLQTVLANLEGTRTVLRLVEPLLATGGAHPGRLLAEVRRSAQLVRSVHPAAIAALPTRTREGLDASLSQLCERLALVAALLEPRRTS